MRTKKTRAYLGALLVFVLGIVFGGGVVVACSGDETAGSSGDDSGTGSGTDWTTGDPTGSGTGSTVSYPGFEGASAECVACITEHVGEQGTCAYYYDACLEDPDCSAWLSCYSETDDCSDSCATVENSNGQELGRGLAKCLCCQNDIAPTDPCRPECQDECNAMNGCSNSPAWCF